jgi:hypothetical protein
MSGGDAIEQEGRIMPNTRNTRRIVGSIILYAVRIVSKESLRVSLFTPVSMPGNGQVNTFLRQGRIAGGVAFYAALAPKENFLFNSFNLPAVSSGPVV